MLLQHRLAHVREVDLSYLDLRGEATSTLASLPCRFPSLRLRYTQLLAGQLEALVEACGLQPLVSLDLDSTPLASLSSTSLVAAISSATSAGLSNTSLSPSQVSALLSSLPSSSLTSLNLSGLDLTEVEVHLLQGAALHLSSLSLAHCSLLPGQACALLQAVVWSLTLDSLDLTSAHLDQVSGQLLGDAACSLSCLDLCGARLATKHLTALLHAISLPSSALELLSLATLDLTTLSPSLLTSSLPAVTSINLSYCKVTIEQVTALLRAVCKVSSRVRSVQLARAHLSPLPSGLLERAMGHLASLSFLHCSLTTSHTLGLATAACRGLQATLVKADLTHIPPSLLARAVKCGLKLRYSKAYA